MTRSPLIIVIGRVLTLLLSLATAPIIAREIGPVGRGHVAAAMVAAMLIPIVLSLGIPIGVRVLTATHGGTSFVRVGRRYAWIALPACLLLGVLAHLTLLHDLESSATTAFLFYSGLGALFIHALCSQSALIVRREYLRVALLQTSQIFVSTIAILVLWAIDAVSVASVLWSQSLGTLAAFSTGLAFVRVGRSADEPRMALRDLVRQSLPYAGGQLAEIAAMKADQLLALPIIGGVQAGYYAVAATIASLPIAVAHALGTIYFRTVAKSAELTANLVAMSAIRVSWLVGVGTTIPIAVATPWLVPLVFGSAFSPASSPTLLALIGSPIAVANYVGSQALAARGRGHEITSAQVLGLATGLGALVLLGPALGAKGAAIASTVGFAVTLIVISMHHSRALSVWIPRRSDVTTLLREARSRD